MIYLITVNYYSAELIQRLLSSVRSHPPEDYHFIVVNNSPADDLLNALASPNVTILQAQKNLGFGGGCNLGLQWVYHRHPHAIVWLINPDTILKPQALERAAKFCAAHPGYSIIGSVIYQPEGTVWFAAGEFNPASGRIIGSTAFPKTTKTYWDTSWVTGCSLLLNLGNFDQCPYFDEAFFLYYEDFDFCQRYLRQGHSVGITAEIEIIHYPSSITQRNRSLSLRRSTYGYLLALWRHTSPATVLYRLARILAHAARVCPFNPPKAIAIIMGVLDFGEYLGRFGKSR